MYNKKNSSKAEPRSKKHPRKRARPPQTMRNEAQREIVRNEVQREIVNKKTRPFPSSAHPYPDVGVCVFFSFYGCGCGW